MSAQATRKENYPHVRVNEPIHCGTCTACCRAFVIDVSAEESANLGLKTVVWEGTQRKVKTKEDGLECLYCQGDKCGVYDKRPRSCRVFDCRMYSCIYLFGGDKATQEVIRIGRKKLLDTGASPSAILNLMVDMCVLNNQNDRVREMIDANKGAVESNPMMELIAKNLVSNNFVLDEVAAVVINNSAENVVARNMFNLWAYIRYTAGRVSPDSIHKVFPKADAIYE